MISRELVENFIKVNGVSPTAPDEKIKEIFLKAQWHDDDVETALSILRENERNEVRKDVVHQVFRSEEKLDDKAIKSLLGISVDFSGHEDAMADAEYKRSGPSAVTMVVLSLIALLVSLLFVFFAMYQLEMGLFHKTSPLHSFLG